MSRVDFDDTAARDEKLSRGARRWQKKELQGYQSKRPPHSAHGDRDEGMAEVYKMT
jgi:hypothetical protein